MMTIAAKSSKTASAVRKIFRPGGTPRPDEGERGQRERDVGGGRERPAAQTVGIVPHERRADQRRHDDASERRDCRQRRSAESR